MGVLDSAISAVPGFGDLWTGYRGEQMQEDAARAARKAARQGMAQQEEAYGDVAALYDPYRQQGASSLQALLGMQGPQMGQFGFGGSVEDYMSPDVQYRQQAAQQAAQQAFGARGALNSSAALKAQQRNAAQIAAEAYSDAFNRRNQERQFAYQDFINRFQAQAAEAQARRQTLGDVVGMGFQATGAQAGARQGLGNALQTGWGNIGAANQMQATAGMNALAAGQKQQDRVASLAGAYMGAK